MFKKVLLSSLVLPFFLSTIFCCCVDEFAFASSTSQVDRCHSHSDSDQNSFPEHSTDSEKQHDCQCAKIFNLADQSSNPQYIAPVFYNFDFHPIVEFIQRISPKSEVYLSFHSPPILEADSVPLYLKHSVLRI